MQDAQPRPLQLTGSVTPRSVEDASLRPEAGAMGRRERRAELGRGKRRDDMIHRRRRSRIGTHQGFRPRVASVTNRFTALAGARAGCSNVSGSPAGAPLATLTLRTVGSSPCLLM